MGKPKESFGKKNVRDKKAKRRKEKEKRRLEKKMAGKKANFEDMIAYVDENGKISDVPPDLTKKSETDLEDIEVSIPKKNKEETSSVRTGIVDFFNEHKGFGFIREDDTNKKFFVHCNTMIDEVREKDKVCFEIRKGAKGMDAFNVKLNR